jgi:uncharacterized protein YlaI
MNIFKALSQGYGSITETNFTSFLSYLLSSDNECSNYLLIIILQFIEKNKNISIFRDILKIKGNSIRELSDLFNNKYKYTVEPERNFGNQRLDIFIRISKKDIEEDLLFLIMEAKIEKSAIKEGQINLQVNKFLEEYTNQSKYIPILISPDDESFLRCYNNLTNELCWIKWSNNDNSVVSFLRELLELERVAMIEPFDVSLTYLIKSFIDYLEKSFSKSNSLNYSVAGIPEKERVLVEIDNKNYTIRRFKNEMIRIYDEEENEINTEIKNELRRINSKYNLGVVFEGKTTHALGRIIISKLKVLQNTGI